MREDAVRALLDKAGADWGVVDSMLTAGSLSRSEYRGEIFYMRTPWEDPTETVTSQIWKTACNFTVPASVLGL
jgi:hypothetical protein